MPSPPVGQKQVEEFQKSRIRLHNGIREWGFKKKMMENCLLCTYIPSLIFHQGVRMWTRTAKLGDITRGVSQRQYLEKSVKSGRNRSLINTNTRLSAITTFVEIPRTVTLVSGATPPPGRKDGRFAPFQSANQVRL